jgi:hypothetical protein
VPRKAIIPAFSLFAQDTWHANRRLTLTYGLRFERVPPPSEATGRLGRTVLGIERDPPENPRLAPGGTPLFHGRFGEFAPRFGVAYQLGTDSGWETTLRGGVGIFYDLGLGNVANAFQAVYPFIAQKRVTNIPFPLATSVRTPPALGVDSPVSLSLLDPNIRMPYTIQWNATLEQGIGQRQGMLVAYVGAAGRRLLLARRYRTALADFPSSTTDLTIQRNLSRSRYDALQMQYVRRLSHGFQALASYTLGRSSDNASSDNALPLLIGSSPLALEWGPSDFDVRHIMSAALTYELPEIPGPSIARVISRDWGVDLLFRYQSAFPVSPSSGFRSIDGVIYNLRANVVPGQSFYITDPTVPGGRRFNPAAFTPAPANQQGNAPRNLLRGFPASQVDFTVRRQFKLKESVRLDFRGEMFNVFNHPNFGPPDSSIANGVLFGQPSSMLNRSLGGLNYLYQMGGPRSVEFAVKVIF